MNNLHLENASFYGILDTGYVSEADWFSKCEQLILGGADIIQLRAKKESIQKKIELLEKILPLFNENTPPLIINDDIEIALKFPNLGLHIGQDDIPAKEARAQLGPNRILGLSTHSIEQAKGAIEQSDLLDYFAVGPVFATNTKPDYIPVGLELVNLVTELKPPLPFYCIGGINLSNIKQVIDNGGRRVVAVSDVLCADDTAKAVKRLLTACKTS
jgi:thiamine-phosphate pyrophosphorylase